MSTTTATTSTTVTKNESTYCNLCKKSLSREAALLRCSQCKSRYYCNRECQRLDWRRGHKIHCRPISAFKELTTIINDMQEPTSWQAFHTARDMVETIQQRKDPNELEAIDRELRSNTSRTQRIQDLQPSVNHAIKNDSIETVLANPSNKSTQRSAVVSSPFSSYSLLRKRAYRTTNPNDTISKVPSTTDPLSTIKIVVEHLPAISAYNILLCIPESDQIPSYQKEDLRVYLEIHQESKTSIHVSQKEARRAPSHHDENDTSSILVSFLLPRKLSIDSFTTQNIHSSIHIQRNPLYQRQEITFRISYNQIPTSNHPIPDPFIEKTYFHAKKNAFKLETHEILAAINQLECRSCGQVLIAQPSSFQDGTTKDTQSRPSIQTILPLPSGHWDEITDYLSCYEFGVIDFASTSQCARQGCALEDPCVLMFHKNDIVNIDILAIEGYGEKDVPVPTTTASSIKKEVPDNRDDPSLEVNESIWKDTIGGATVCCNQCCMTLGYASLTDAHAFRLLKHKLTAPLCCTREQGRDYLENNSCGSFVARELLRYAETYGIFTFIITPTSCNIPGSIVNDDDRQRLLDRAGATLNTAPCLYFRLLSWNTEIATDSMCIDNSLNHDLTFDRVLKIVFHETLLKNAIPSNPLQDMLQTDWCCPSSVSSTEMVTKNDKSACLYLSYDEWKEVRESVLDGNSYFNHIVSKSTVCLRLGKMSESAFESKTAGLSILRLPALID